jgi:hypothetical protein
MDINKDNAIKLWDERYRKNTQTITDFSGRKMTKGQYGDTSSKSGWTIDHRMPISNGGTNAKCNLEIVNHKTNAEKADKITFTANGKQFQVQKDDSGNGCYKIVELKSNKPISNQKTTQKTDLKREIAEKLFNETIEDDLDMAGRCIKFDMFEKSDDVAWGIGYYTNKKDLSIENCFVAHVKTLADQEGKSSFKSNDMVFELKKIDGRYHYLNTSKILDKNDYYNVLGYTSNLFKQEQTIFKDLVTLKINYVSDKDLSKFLILLEELLSIASLRNNYIIKKDIYGWGESKIYIIFDTPKENNTCTAHEFAMYMNTLRGYLIKISSIKNVTIYHSTHEINAAEYSTFVYEIDCHFENKVRNNETNTIFLSEDVKNHIIKCKYKEDSFSKRFNYYERNYIFPKLKDLIKNFS